MANNFRKLLCRVIFGGICSFNPVMSAQAFFSAKNLPKVTLHGNCHSSGPIQTTKVPDVTMGPAFFKYKMPIRTKCLVVAIDEMEVQI